MFFSAHFTCFCVQYVTSLWSEPCSLSRLLHSDLNWKNYSQNRSTCLEGENSVRHTCPGDLSQILLLFRVAQSNLCSVRHIYSPPADHLGFPCLWFTTSVITLRKGVCLCVPIHAHGSKCPTVASDNECVKVSAF